MINKLISRLKKKISDSNRIDKNVKVGSHVAMAGCTLNGGIVIGNNTKLYHVNINGKVTIGNYTSLWGPNINLDVSINDIKIGNFCSIAKNVTFQEYNHDYTQFTTYFIRQNLFKDQSFREEIVSKGGIKIEHDVWIGAHSVILGGAHISTGAIIAANSVVNGYIPPYAIAAGSPAKVIKYRFEQDKIEKLLETRWWDWTEDRIKTQYNYLKSI